MTNLSKSLLFLILCLLPSTLAASYSSLQPGTRLTPQDQLISTLGLFKLLLNSNDCSLMFWRWDDPTQSYLQAQVKYIGNQNGSCQWLTVTGNRVVTDTGAIFLSLSSNNTAKTYLMVDDAGTLRLIGILNVSIGLPATDFQEFKFTNNSQSSQYLIILDSFRRVSEVLPNPVTNANNWIFYFSPTELTISRSNNFYSFKTSNTLFSQSGLFDNQN